MASLALARKLFAEQAVLFGRPQAVWLCLARRLASLESWRRLRVKRPDVHHRDRESTGRCAVAHAAERDHMKGKCMAQNAGAERGCRTWRMSEGC